MKHVTLAEHEFVAVDLDRTLAYFEWKPGYSPLTIGGPIISRIVQVRGWLKRGIPVKLVTARVSSNHPFTDTRAAVRRNIENWCIENLGQHVEVTSEKGFGCRALLDDIAVPVTPNRDKPFSLSVELES